MVLETLIEKLKFDNERVLTAKEIRERDISKYYIKKLVEQNILIKQEYGKYLVLLNIDNEKNIRDVQIRSFKYNIRHYQFGKAYNNLVKFYKSKPKYFSYEYVYICFSLLQQLLGETYDFNELEELKHNQELQASDLSYQSALKLNILEENYQEAFYNLYEIKNNGHTLDVDILFILLKEVVKKKKITVNFKSVEDIGNIYSYFIQFKKSFKSENYEEAKANMQKCIELDINNKISFKEELLILVEGLIDILNNKIKFYEDKRIAYEGSHEEILIQAIQNKDFKVAFSKIGACTYKTTNTSYLLMKDILYKMYDLKKDDLKREEKIIPRKKHKKYEETPITSLLYSYVMNDQFKEAEELICSFSTEERATRYAMLLFDEFNDVKKEYVHYGKNRLYFENLFKQVFEAIRCYDFYQAKKSLEKSIFLVKDKKEFQIYAKLIDEILLQNQINKSKLAFQKKLSPFFKNNKILSMEAVLEVKGLLEERIQLFGENKSDYYLLNIIDVIISASEVQIAKDNFSSLPSEKEKPLDKLNEYLQNGEFLLALDVINSNFNWKVFENDYSLFDIEMFEYLLRTLESFLYQYKHEEREIYPLTLEESSSFYSLVEDCKYKEALQFYLEHGDLLYETENKDLIKNLIVLFYFQSEEGVRLYEEYLNAKEQSNRDLERIALLNYKEYLKINNIDENYIPVLKK